MKKTINILIAEDHFIFREALASLLKHFKINVLGAFENGLDLISSLETLDPDLVLLDLEMPIMNGSATAQAVLEKYPAIKVIILTQYDNAQLAKHLIDRGVSAFFPKSVEIDILAETIKQVVRFNISYNPYENDKINMETKAGNYSVKFSKRESEVIALIHQGKSNKEISSNLNIVIKTVEAHKKKIYSKIGVKNLSQFLVISLKSGFDFLIK